MIANWPTAFLGRPGVYVECQSAFPAVINTLDAFSLMSSISTLVSITIYRPASHADSHLHSETTTALSMMINEGQLFHSPIVGTQSGRDEIGVGPCRISVGIAQ